MTENQTTQELQDAYLDRLDADRSVIYVWHPEGHPEQIKIGKTTVGTKRWSPPRLSKPTDMSPAAWAQVEAAYIAAVLEDGERVHLAHAPVPVDKVDEAEAWLLGVFGGLRIDRYEFFKVNRAEVLLALQGVAALYGDGTVVTLASDTPDVPLGCGTLPVKDMRVRDANGRTGVIVKVQANFGPNHEAAHLQDGYCRVVWDDDPSKQWSQRARSALFADANP